MGITDKGIRCCLGLQSLATGEGEGGKKTVWNESGNDRRTRGRVRGRGKGRQCWRRDLESQRSPRPLDWKSLFGKPSPLVSISDRQAQGKKRKSKRKRKPERTGDLDEPLNAFYKDGQAESEEEDAVGESA